VILLLGGTGETAELASLLAAAGHDVLVSTATEISLNIGGHPRIRRCCGRLDAAAMSELIRRENIAAIVDAAHPYAVELHHTARKAGAETGICVLRFRRPDMGDMGDGIFGVDYERIVNRAADHEEAARMAVEFGRRILLTTGANNLEPYARAARENHIELYVRVLPEITSLDACERAGIPGSRVIGARGPFSLDDNRLLLRSFKIDVLVSKDSGEAGGLREKLEAARLENCRVVLVERPPETDGHVFGNYEDIIAGLMKTDPAPMY
jgi:precorrin-6A/cobalt-precorrin-6A reductase